MTRKSRSPKRMPGPSSRPGMVVDSTFHGVECSPAAPLLCLGPAPDSVEASFEAFNVPDFLNPFCPLHVEGAVAQVDQDLPHVLPPPKGGSPRHRPIGLCKDVCSTRQ